MAARACPLAVWFFKAGCLGGRDTVTGRTVADCSFLPLPHRAVINVTPLPCVITPCSSRTQSKTPPPWQLDEVVLLQLKAESYFP
ncbi:hypothetical protein LR48_Vigan1944s000100 [Vigna angularis]|uniref:Uncharacterized protein n=1 Tax=Phaseolus angularis TaxID=3914 RepID=A0A0L9TIP0_PHAAN|nr:hypothetical protein LR48_Vigan1944s000100 [Vigna angularis]